MINSPTLLFFGDSHNRSMTDKDGLLATMGGPPVSKRLACRIRPQLQVRQIG